MVFNEANCLSFLRYKKLEVHFTGIFLIASVHYRVNYLLQIRYLRKHLFKTLKDLGQLSHLAHGNKKASLTEVKTHKFPPFRMYPTNSPFPKYCTGKKSQRLLPLLTVASKQNKMKQGISGKSVYIQQNC